ncbi:hypothetical protein [Paenibacillus bouchesdurhonensis]|uniref:hypothetical protein n=1 Tax=Paenibacillus bouchesdurhonensis TaxID=1870990 RepID=UPI000DA60D7F|nr:hypothetical protein [Paenibacillus bouchesdurhonensis]
MKAKKLFILTLVVVLFSSFGSISFAEPKADSGGTVIYQAEEITDLDVLFDRAKNGISDVTNDSEQALFVVQSPSDNNDNIKQYTTTQKLLAVQNGEELVETFSKVSFLVITNDYNSSENGNLIRPFGSKEEEEWDSGYGLRAYSKVNYTRTLNNNVYAYKLDSVSGGWDKSDSRYILSDRKVVYGISGNAQGSGIGVSRSSGNLYPSGNTFSYTAPSSWPALETNLKMGVNTYITIERGTSSTWTLHHQNNLTQ